MDETTVRVEKTLESAIAEIDTPEKAKDVLHAIEREAAGQTEAKNGDQAKEAPPSAAAAVESAAARPAPSSERVAHTLVETAAQAVAKTPEAGAVIAAAQEVADTRHQITTPPDVKRGHELLERAVVEDMAAGVLALR
jgi:hypothetical protein